MAAPLWDPGHLYAPGSLVQPRTVHPPVDAPIINGDFESGDLTGWDVVREGGAGGTFAVSGDRPFAGSYCARWLGAPGSSSGGGTASVWMNQAEGIVVAGQRIRAHAYIAQDDTGSSQNYGNVRIYWFRDDGTSAGDPTVGSMVAGNFSDYRISTATGNAPPGAAYARLGIWLSANSSGGMHADNATWDYAPEPTSVGLIYKAVQPASGRSAETEPTWPPTLGVQVNDGAVIWEAVQTRRVIWEAHEILKSGPDEPTWPTEVGGSVTDGSMIWAAVSRRVEDPKCPHSPYVLRTAGKIFMGDTDIIPFCATNNPLDWSTRNDAGYLPFGMNPFGNMPCNGLGEYRSNIVATSKIGFQMWQVDPDPANNALIDTKPIGSVEHRALVPVGNELVILSGVGLRTIGIAAGSTNLAAGDIGMPVDTLVQQLMRGCEARGDHPFATYLPAYGQHFLAFPNSVEGTTRVIVCTMNQQGSPPSFSSYRYNFLIEDFLQEGTRTWFRTDNEIYEITEEQYRDGANDGFATPYEVKIRWHFLDFGAPGVDKTTDCFEIVGYGIPKVRFFWDQTDELAVTDYYTLPEDTVPGTPAPIELTAPSLSVELTYDANGQYVEFNALQLFLIDRRPTS